MIAFAAKEMLTSLRTGRVRTTMAVLTVSIAMLIFCGLLFLSHNLLLGLAGFRSTAKIDVLLKNDADLIGLAAKIIELDGVARTRGYTRAEALEYFRNVQGDDLARGITEAMDGIPFPAFIEVRLEPGVTEVEPLARRIGELDGVSEVLYGAETVARLSRIAGTVQTVSTTINLIMTVFVLLIIINSVRATVHDRAKDMYVMRLVGASDGWIISPFLLEGALVGCFGALVGCAVTYLAYRSLLPQIPYFRLHFLTREVAASVVIVGTAVGALGGLLASREALHLQSEDV